MTHEEEYLTRDERIRFLYRQNRILERDLAKESEIVTILKDALEHMTTGTHELAITIAIDTLEYIKREAKSINYGFLPEVHQNKEKCND